MVVQIIGQWSVETILETTERKVVYPVQHPTDTPETNNVNLPQHLAKFHKNPILGPEVMTSLGPQAKIHRDPQQADKTSNNHNAPHRANQIIKIVFLTGIIGTVINRDRHDSTKSRIKCILLITLPLPLHSLQALTCLVTLSCSLQKHNPVHFEIFAAQQKAQIDVYQELTRSNKEKEHDALFTSIPVFDGDCTQCEQWLDNMDQATRISG